MEGYVIDDYAKGVSLFVRLVDQIQHLKMDGLEQFLAKRELKINNGRIEPIPRPVPQQGLPHQ
jgi:hypothetical protein